MLVDHAFLEGNNGVVRDRYVLGANFRAALGDVAVTNAVTLLQLVRSIENV